ncbi:MAG: SAM-dependent methyltransferase [Myxococcota bacterium]
MESLTASRTALMVAAYRARATARAEAICADPWAEALAGAEGHAIAQRFDEAWPAMELWIALRTRVLDDGLAGLLDGGVDQVVLLGAGYDTRAARMARRGLRFFEVDHPATQAGKLARLAGLTGYPEGAATHVACDFEHDDFNEVLARAGFDAERPAAVIWEGVTPYLPEDAVRQTLARVAGGMHPSTVLMFDYVARVMASGDGLRDEDRAMRDTLDGLGEPMRWGTNHVLPILHQTGFTRVRTLAMDEACLEHTGTYERARAFRFQGVAFASVAPDGPRWI